MDPSPRSSFRTSRRTSNHLEAASPLLRLTRRTRTFGTSIRPRSFPSSPGRVLLETRPARILAVFTCSRELRMAWSRLGSAGSRSAVRRRPFSLTNFAQFTNFQPAPDRVPFTQDGKWSIPMSPSDSSAIPEAAVDSIRQFVKIFLPDFDEVPFHSTKLCWYTDSLDNSFVVRTRQLQSRCNFPG